MNPRQSAVVRRATALIAAASLFLDTACYSYLPPVGGTLPVASELRIELTPEGTVALQPALGPRIRVVEGRLRSTDSDGTALVDVDQLTSMDGASAPFAGRDAVRVPRSAIARADVRTLDRKQSWTAAAIVGGIFLAAVITALIKARSRASGDVGRIGASPPDIRAP